MSPAEAGAIELEEPDWRERFEEHILRWPKLPRWLAEDNAFEAVLTDWRRFHWTPIEVDGQAKKAPAGATEAIIALAKLGIMAPRSAWVETPRTNATGYQCDDHMWLSIAGEQWRITGVEARMLCLQKGFQADVETKQINLTTAKWESHNAAAVELLEALRG